MFFFWHLGPSVVWCVPIIDVVLSCGHKMGFIKGVGPRVGPILLWQMISTLFSRGVSEGLYSGLGTNCPAYSFAHTILVAIPRGGGVTLRKKKPPCDSYSRGESYLHPAFWHYLDQETARSRFSRRYGLCCTQPGPETNPGGGGCLLL